DSDLARATGALATGEVPGPTPQDSPRRRPSARPPPGPPLGDRRRVPGHGKIRGRLAQPERAPLLGHRTYCPFAPGPAAVARADGAPEWAGQDGPGRPPGPGRPLSPEGPMGGRF